MCRIQEGTESKLPVRGFRRFAPYSCSIVRAHRASINFRFLKQTPPLRDIIVWVISRNRCRGKQEKDEEGIMKMRVTLRMKNVLIGRDAKILSSLHSDIRQ